MPFARLHDTKLYYEQSGAGPDLLIISGTGSDLRIPRLPIPQLDESYRILRYDHRGLGQSGTSEAAVTMANFADDTAALLEILHISRIDIIGISFGGMVAQHLAIRHPKLIGKLVLACTSPGGPSYSSADLLELMKLPLDERHRTWMKMYDTRYSHASEENYFVYFLEKLLLRNPDMFPNGASDGLMRQLRARSDHDVTSSLHEITHPCLIAGGKYDGIAPPENLHYLAKRIALSSLHFFEGGHSFLLEDHSAWETISAFLMEDQGNL